MDKETEKTKKKINYERNCSRYKIQSKRCFVQFRSHLKCIFFDYK